MHEFFLDSLYLQHYSNTFDTLRILNGIRLGHFIFVIINVYLLKIIESANFELALLVKIISQCVWIKRKYDVFLLKMKTSSFPQYSVFSIEIISEAQGYLLHVSQNSWWEYSREYKIFAETHFNTHSWFVCPKINWNQHKLVSIGFLIVFSHKQQQRDRSTL